MNKYQTNTKRPTLNPPFHLSLPRPSFPRPLFSQISQIYPLRFCRLTYLLVMDVLFAKDKTQGQCMMLYLLYTYEQSQFVYCLFRLSM